MMFISSVQGVRGCLTGAMMALTTLTAPAMAHEYRVGDMEVMHPYAPPTPPGAPMAAGYLEIINHGDQDERLLGGKVNFAHELQLHETTVEDDVSRMRQITEGLVIPAGATVTFQPMGKHLMFVDLAEPLVDGDRQDATLFFEHAGELEVEFAIEHADAESMDHGAMNHKEMNHEDMNHGDMSEEETMEKDSAHKH